MIRFKINGGFQHKEAEKLAENVPHTNVRKTFVEVIDEEAGTFAMALTHALANARSCHDRGRTNALHSIRRHFEEARSDRD